MKKLIKISLMLAAVLLSMSSIAQIDSLLGVYDLDSCKLETICHLIKTDTSAGDMWEIGTPAKTYFDSAYSATNAIVTRLSLPYDTSNHSFFELRIPNPMFTNMIVGFKHKFQTDTLVDGGYVETSYDHGLTWFNSIDDTYPIIFNTENFYTAQDTLKGGKEGFSGISDGWIFSRLQWVWAMLTKTYPPDTLYLRFNFISDGIQTNKEGWMIDNISVSFADLPGSVPKLTTDNIKLYPNPFSCYTTISLGSIYTEPLSLKVYDAKGQIVRYEDGIMRQDITVNKSNLKAGSYYVILHTSKKIVFKDILIVQ